MIPKKDIKSLFHLFTSSFIGNLLSLIRIILIYNRYSLKEIGIFYFVNTITLIITQILLSPVQPYFIRKYHQNTFDDEEVKNYFSFIIMLNLLFSTFVFVYSKNIYATSFILVELGLLTVQSFALDITIKEKFQSLTVSVTLGRTLSILFVLFGVNIFFVYVIDIIIQIIVMVLYSKYVQSLIEKFKLPSLTGIINIMKNTKHFMISSMFSNVLTSIDTIIIKYLLGYEMIALYRTGQNYLSSVMSIIGTINKLHFSRGKLVKSSTGIMIIGSLIAFGVGFLKPDWICLLLNIKVTKDVVLIMRVFSIMIILRTIQLLNSVTIIFSNREDILSKTIVIVSTINIVGDIIFGILYGIIGIILTTLFSEFIKTLILYVYRNPSPQIQTHS